MNFNLMSTLLAVSSAHDTVHIFKLGNTTGITRAASSSSSTQESIGASSPSESVDGATQGLDGGYEAFVEKKQTSSVS